MINTDKFIEDGDNILHFSWKCTNPEISLDSLVTTSSENNCPRGDAAAGGIALSEEQFEELTSNTPTRHK